MNQICVQVNQLNYYGLNSIFAKIYNGRIPRERFLWYSFAWSLILLQLFLHFEFNFWLFLVTLRKKCNKWILLELETGDCYCFLIESRNSLDWNRKNSDTENLTSIYVYYIFERRLSNFFKYESTISIPYYVESSKLLNNQHN